MHRKIILFLAGIILFSGFNFAQAEVIINEAQLFSTTERFLELYNTGSLEVDLTNWYMQRKTATGNSFSSLVSNPNFEGKTIGAHDYFVISRDSLSNSDIVLSSLTLAESNTIQIKNSSQEVIDKISWGDTNDCGNPCPSNPSEGQSIQKTGTGSWIIATPTPGEANETASVSSPADNVEEDISTATASNEIKIKATSVPAIKAKILANALAFAGQPLEMETDISGLSNENVVLGRASWNFGDGSFLEQVNNFEKFYHTYYYPGEYVLFLEYYQGNFSKTPEASSKMIIKVLPITVTISKVGDAKDFFIELSNNAGSDIDISNWVISANGKIFILPKNSVILSKKIMTISGKITGFSYADRSNLKLFSSTRELIFNYPSPTAPIMVAPVKISVPLKLSNNQDSSIAKPMEEYSEGENKVNSTAGLQITGEDFLASVASNNVVKDNPIRLYILALISTVFIGASAGAVYFIRQKKTVSKAGDDFKILDE